MQPHPAHGAGFTNLRQGRIAYQFSGRKFFEVEGAAAQVKNVGVGIQVLAESAGECIKPLLPGFLNFHQPRFAQDFKMF